jgi:RND family efflux transporter MFP subunit
MKKQFMCLFVAGTLLTACTGNQEQINKKPEIPVEIMKVKFSHIQPQQNYVGTIEETFSSSLSFQVPGYVSSIHIREGEKVNKGDLIACLDKTTLKNSYDAALSTLKQAEDAYRRMKALYDNKSLPEIKWIEIQTSLQQAKSMESIARKKLEDCCLYAPFSGIIAKRNIETGTNVMPGMPTFKLVTIDNIKTKVAIPEKEITHIQIGQTAAISVSALNDKHVIGKISEKGVSANPLSHTYEIKIALNNPEGDIMPGMVCNVNINTKNNDNPQIIIPTKIVQVMHNGDKFVWLAVDNHAQQRVIKTGQFHNNGVIVTEGLTIGEQLITGGYQKVSEGMKISIR